MDKLNQNLYWIAVGATGVVLLVLTYFLVLSPLSALSGKRSDLDAMIAKVDGFTKRKFVPNVEYKKNLEGKETASKDAEEKGKVFYEGQGKRFKFFFDDVEAPPAAADFSARYKDELDKLIKAYQEKFKIVQDANDPSLTPPKVMRVLDADESKVPMAMKEFWFIQESFNACNKLELGGLQSIEFIRAEAKEALPFNKWMSGTVQIEMPFAKIENFLSELYASERVPFQLEELSFQKTAASVGKFAALDDMRQFKDKGEAQKAETIQDPGVVVQMRLGVFDWTGAPEVKAVAPTAEKDDAGNKSSGKPGKPPRNPPKPK